MPSHDVVRRSLRCSSEAATDREGGFGMDLEALDRLASLGESAPSGLGLVGPLEPYAFERLAELSAAQPETPLADAEHLDKLAELGRRRPSA